eukprot:3927666-Prymnesium_polylepis.1
MVRETMRDYGRPIDLYNRLACDHKSRHAPLRPRVSRRTMSIACWQRTHGRCTCWPRLPVYSGKRPVDFGRG